MVSSLLLSFQLVYRSCGSKRASREFSSRLKFAPWYAKGSDLRHVESLLKALAVSSCHKSHSLESPTFAPATKELGFFKIRVLAWKGEPLDSVFQADSTRVPEPPAVWLPHPGTHHSSHQVQQIHANPFLLLSGPSPENPILEITPKCPKISRRSMDPWPRTIPPTQ